MRSADKWNERLHGRKVCSCGLTDMNASFTERTEDMKYSIEWFYALVSGKLVKPENVYVKCPRCGKLCNKGCDRKPCGRNQVKHG